MREAPRKVCGEVGLDLCELLPYSQNPTAEIPLLGRQWWQFSGQLRILWCSNGLHLSAAPPCLDLVIWDGVQSPVLVCLMGMVRILGKSVLGSRTSVIHFCM